MPSTSDGHDAGTVSQRWFVHINDQTLGPYALSDIRLMVSKHQIGWTDLVHAESGTGWIQAKDDLALRSLFGKKTDGPSRQRTTTISFKRATLAIAAFVLVGIVWFLWPYYAFYRLTVAFRTGDVPALESGVAWDTVRQGLRSDINAALLPFINGSPNNKDSEPGSKLATAFAGVLAPVIVNKIVDGYVTPQAIAAARTGNDNPPEQNLVKFAQQIKSVGGASWDQLEYMFFDGSPFTFKVQVRPPHDAPLKAPFTIILNWSGRWMVTRIMLPSDVFEGLVAARNQNMSNPKLSDFSPPTASTLAATSAATNDEALSHKKHDYFQLLEIYDFKAHYYSSYERRIPGVEFKIKNKGTETLKMVQVTVYFKDSGGNVIAEQDYTPVLVSRFSFSDDKPLRPNYIWQMERGGFLAAKSVPSEWKEGAADIRITDLRFEGEHK